MCNIEAISNIAARNALIAKIIIEKKTYRFESISLLISFIRFMLLENVYTTHVLKELITFSNVLT